MEQRIESYIINELFGSPSPDVVGHSFTLKPVRLELNDPYHFNFSQFTHYLLENHSDGLPALHEAMERAKGRCAPEELIDAVDDFDYIFVGVNSLSDVNTDVGQHYTFSLMSFASAKYLFADKFTSNQSHDTAHVSKRFPMVVEQDEAGSHQFITSATFDFQSIGMKSEIQWVPLIPITYDSNLITPMTGFFACPEHIKEQIKARVIEWVSMDSL